MSYGMVLLPTLLALAVVRTSQKESCTGNNALSKSVSLESALRPQQPATTPHSWLDNLTKLDKEQELATRNRAPAPVVYVKKLSLSQEKERLDVLDPLMRVLPSVTYDYNLVRSRPRKDRDDVESGVTTTDDAPKVKKTSINTSHRSPAILALLCLPFVFLIIYASFQDATSKATSNSTTTTTNQKSLISVADSTASDYALAQRQSFGFFNDISSAHWKRLRQIFLQHENHRYPDKPFTTHPDAKQDQFEAEIWEKSLRWKNAFRSVPA
jgi:hypothetical protein